MRKKQRNASYIRRRKKNPDYIIIFCVAALIIFGLVMLASASSNLGKVKFNDTYYYLKHQILYGLSFGIAGFFLASNIFYKKYEKFAILFLIAAIISLILVFTPFGFNAKGASRWIAVGLTTFQPSEFAKFALIIYLSAWLSGKTERQKSVKRGFVPFFLVTSLIAGLLLFQPATSTTVILILTALIIYFASGARLAHTFIFSGIFALIFLITIYITPYRWDRVVNFINPEENTETGNYHLIQAKNAIGSGGLLGVGFGQSTTKLNYLPEPVGDTIFAVIAEEFGFIGVISLMSVFLLLITRILILAYKFSDNFGKLLLTGFGSLIALQTMLHISAISGIIPLTGTPLPFISFGGTALAAFMTASGVIVNISKYA